MSNSTRTSSGVAPRGPGFHRKCGPRRWRCEVKCCHHKSVISTEIHMLTYTTVKTNQGTARDHKIDLQLEKTYPWHVLFLQEAFKRKRTLSLWTGGLRLFSATEMLRGFRGRAILIRQDYATTFNVTFLGSGCEMGCGYCAGSSLASERSPSTQTTYFFTIFGSSSRSSNFSGLLKSR